VPNSIAARLIFVLTASAVIIIAAGMLLDYRISRQEILQRLNEQATMEVQVVIADLENWLNGVEATTALLARILEQRSYSRDNLQDMIRDVVANNDEIFGAAIALNPALAEAEGGFAPYYYTKDGQTLYADLASRKARYQEQAWFTEPLAQGRAMWSEPYFDAGGGEVDMTTFSVPVYRSGADGKRIAYAVVTADVTLDALNKVLQQLHLGNSSHGLLFSREGIVMSARNDASSMQHYTTLHYQGLDKDSWHQLFQRALRGETSTMDFPCRQRDERCTIRLGRLNTTGWPVGVGYRQAEVLSPLHRYEIKTAAVSAATLLLVVLAVFLVTSRLTRPLAQLTRATEDMASGNLDIPLPRASGDDEIARLVRSFGTMNRELKTYIADLESATATRSRIEGELAAARDIQMSMLPEGGEALVRDAAASLWARVAPARTVGGDLYSYFQRQRQLFLAVGDVSDKGVPAALFMARAISLIQQIHTPSTPPETAMAELNNALERDNENCMFVTLFLGVLDIDTGELCFASAGHTAPSLLRGSRVDIIEQRTGPALGLAPDQDYPRNTLQLLNNDRLAIFTDGIDEAFNETGDMFGIDRFNQALQASSDEDIAAAGDNLFQRIRQHAGVQPQSDDITLLLLDYTPESEQRARQDFDLAEQLTARVQAWMTPILADWGIPAAAAGELKLVAEEIVTNIQKYAGLDAAGNVELLLQRDGDTLTLETTDPGRAFDPLHDAHRSTLGADIETAEIGGLGVHLLTQLTDHQSYRRTDGLNRLRVQKILSTLAVQTR